MTQLMPPSPVTPLAQGISASLSHTEISVSPDEAKLVCQEDLFLLGMLCMPDTVEIDFPPIFKQMWKLLTTAVISLEDFTRFAIGLPRGHGKTLVIKLLIVYIICYTKRKFVLVVGASLELAVNVIADVVDILDSENFRQVFGNWRYSLETDQQHFKKFSFMGRPVILKAAGSGTAIRGIAVKNSRPDVIICDDAQTKESSESPNESLKFVKWFLGTLMKAKNPRCCTYIYVGNMYPDIEIHKGLYCCMLRNLQQNPAWTSFIVGGILADGEALWPELHSKDQLLAELAQDVSMGQEDIFYAEVLNDPAAISSRILDTKKISAFTKEPEDLHFGNFIIIDPSGTRRKSDETAMGYVELYDGRPTLMKLSSERMSPMQTIHKALTWALEYRCGAIICESVAYQATLLFWFNEVMQQRDIQGIQVLPIEPGGISKNVRILRMFRQWEAGEVQCSEEAHAQAVAQAVRFNPLITNNTDDILDIMAYMPLVCINYPEALVLQGTAAALDGEFNSIPGVDNYAYESIILGGYNGG